MNLDLPSWLLNLPLAVRFALVNGVLAKVLEEGLGADLHLLLHLLLLPHPIVRGAGLVGWAC